MEQKTTFIKIGDFFFKYRNSLFPAVLLLLFFSFRTRDSYFGKESYEQIKDIAAACVVLLGLSIRAAVIGFRYIKRGGMNKKVYAENLVTDGFFAVCRNPLYVANIIIYAGVLLMHGAPAVFILGMTFFLFVYTAIVAAEEYFLRTHFGEGYQAYCTDVPRWGLRLSRLKGATLGMKFNLKRALLKDYGTIVNAVVSVAALELMEDFQWDEHEMRLILLTVIATTIVAGLCVRVLKRRGHLKVT